MSIGKRIMQRRNSLKLSQDELAKKLGYSSRSSIAKIEKGINDIPQVKVFEFAKALRTTPAYLLGYADVEEENVTKDEYLDFKLKDGTSMTIITDNKKIEILIKMWNDKVGEFLFNEDEFNELINYANFIISKRR